ncbi:hypothetical protein, partial [Ruminococcus champanellensis]|uniref:hypothetical protein n=1 Tax=Ruminococcus champanellensis TaxID=1161942 RepID=UPI001A98C9C7
YEENARKRWSRKVNGSCVTHTVNQIEQHTSPQDIGKTVLRKNSTQSIKDNTQETGHKQQSGKAAPILDTSPHWCYNNICMF